jgi:hypothetical protein
MKTTKAQFEAFKGEFQRWQGLLGLTYWRVRFHHEPLDGGRAACICPDCCSWVVGVYLGFTIDHSLEELARHEALELLLAHVNWLPSQRYVREEEIDAARHAVIRRLENFLDSGGLGEGTK